MERVPELAKRDDRWEALVLPDAGVVLARKHEVYDRFDMRTLRWERASPTQWAHARWQFPWVPLVEGTRDALEAQVAESWAKACFVTYLRVLSSPDAARSAVEAARSALLDPALWRSPGAAPGGAVRRDSRGTMLAGAAMELVVRGGRTANVEVLVGVVPETLRDEWSTTLGLAHGIVEALDRAHGEALGEPAPQEALESILLEPGSSPRGERLLGSIQHGFALVPDLFSSLRERVAGALGREGARVVRTWLGGVAGLYAGPAGFDVLVEAGFDVPSGGEIEHVVSELRTIADEGEWNGSLGRLEAEMVQLIPRVDPRRPYAPSLERMLAFGASVRQVQAELRGRERIVLKTYA